MWMDVHAGYTTQDIQQPFVPVVDLCLFMTSMLCDRSQHQKWDRFMTSFTLHFQPRVFDCRCKSLSHFSILLTNVILVN